MKTNVMLALGMLLAISAANPLIAQPGPNTVVMTVNDQPIYFWEVRLVMPQVQVEMLKQGAQPDREAVVRTAVKRVVDAHLLAQEARKKELQPDNARVDATMAQFEEKSGGRDGLVSALERVGVSYDQLRSNISEADLVKVYIETQIDPQVTVTATEVETFYKQNPELFDRPDMIRARHILFRTPQQADQATKNAARAKATAAHERVAGGEDFAAVAIDVSEGPNASKGGDLGFFARDSMVPALSGAAFALDIGEISGVIETQFGFHIVKVEEKKAASTMLFPEVKNGLELMLKRKKAGELVTKRLSELNRAASIVEVTPPGVATDVADGG